MATEPDGNGVALITGASSGIGAVFVEELAREGYSVVLVARRRERLEEAAKKIEATGGSAEVLVADLASAQGLASVEERLRAGDVTLLVNNAGFQTYMPFVELPVERAQAEIDVQVTAMMRLTHAVLPGMIGRGEGAVINVCSMLSYTGEANVGYLPKRSVYASTKAFGRVFSTLLAVELEGTGVKVQALCPAAVRTEFHDLEGEPAALRPKGAPVMEPEDVVKASLAGLELEEVVCIPALEDREMLDAVAEADGAVFDAGRGAELAPHYH